MAHQAYMKLGDIKGPGRIKRENSEKHIAVIAVRHEVAAALNEEGIAGERRHHKLVVTKNVDFTTPKLHEALNSGVPFDSGWIHFFHMPRSGDEHGYFTMTMTGIQIVGIKSIMPSTQTAETADIHEYEEVSMVYSGINWTSHAPPERTLESGAYGKTECSEPQAKFGFDWLDDAPEAYSLEILNYAKESAKAKILEEAKKKTEESKKQK